MRDIQVAGPDNRLFFLQLLQICQHIHIPFTDTVVQSFKLLARVRDLKEEQSTSDTRISHATQCLRGTHISVDEEEIGELQCNRSTFVVTLFDTKAVRHRDGLSFGQHLNTPNNQT